MPDISPSAGHPFLVAFGKRLRELRLATGQTQRDIQRKLQPKCKPMEGGGHLSLIERGNQNPSLMKIKQLADVIGVDAADLFTSGSAGTRPTFTREQLDRYFKQHLYTPGIEGYDGLLDGMLALVNGNVAEPPVKPAGHPIPIAPSPRKLARKKYLDNGGRPRRYQKICLLPDCGNRYATDIFRRLYCCRAHQDEAVAQGLRAELPTKGGIQAYAK
jgi:transcriptional regulator with XRE-family HTH domain